MSAFGVCTGSAAVCSMAASQIAQDYELNRHRCEECGSLLRLVEQAGSAAGSVAARPEPQTHQGPETRGLNSTVPDQTDMATQETAPEAASYAARDPAMSFQSEANQRGYEYPQSGPPSDSLVRQSWLVPALGIVAVAGVGFGIWTLAGPSGEPAVPHSEFVAPEGEASGVDGTTGAGQAGGVDIAMAPPGVSGPAGIGPDSQQQFSAPPGAAPEGAEQIGEPIVVTTYYVASLELNLRILPNPESASLAKLPFGTQLTADRQSTFLDPETGIARVWVRAKVGDLVGWVNSSLISRSILSAPLDQTTRSTVGAQTTASQPRTSNSMGVSFRAQAVVTAVNANLRSRPDISGNNVITVLPNGSELVVQRVYEDTDRVWYLVESSDGNVGWISGVNISIF